MASTLHARHCAVDVLLWINPFNTHNGMSSVLIIHILQTLSNSTAGTELFSGEVLDLHPKLSDCPALATPTLPYLS